MRKVLWIGMSLYLLAWTNVLAAQAQPLPQPNAASPRAAEKPLVFIAPVDYEP
jgi:uncharacterized protein YhhL (DUF1145 family)